MKPKAIVLSLLFAGATAFAAAPKFFAADANVGTPKNESDPTHVVVQTANDQPSDMADASTALIDVTPADFEATVTIDSTKAVVTNDNTDPDPVTEPTENFDYKVKYGNGDDAQVASRDGKFTIFLSRGEDAEHTAEAYADHIGGKLFSGDLEVPITFYIGDEIPGVNPIMIVMVDGMPQKDPETGKWALLPAGLVKNAKYFVELHAEANKPDTAAAANTNPTTTVQAGALTLD